MPEPWRDSASPRISNEIIASRMVGRLTLKAAARSRSEGRRSPGLYFPDMIDAITVLATCW